MDPIRQHIEQLTRRHFFGRTGLSLGSAALVSLLGESARSDTVPTSGSIQVGGLPSLPHFPPKAKRAIYLFMNGGPSQMDLFDYKPKMDPMFDKDLPESIRNGQRLTTMTSGQSRFPVAPSKYRFARHGQAGHMGQRALALHGQDRRSDRAGEDRLDRGDQPRSSRHLYLYG